MGGGGGSIQGFNTSLKNNRMLLRTSHFYPKKKSFFNRKKEYIKAAQGYVELEKATKEELLEVRKKVLRQRRKSNLLTIAFSLVLIPLFIYFSINLIKTTPKVASPEEIQAFHEKNEKYLFFVNDGDSYLKKGKWHNAIFQYNKALELFPSNYDIKYRLGYAYTYRCRNEGKDCKKGSEYVDELIQTYPNKPELIELKVNLEFEDSQ